MPATTIVILFKDDAGVELPVSIEQN